MMSKRALIVLAVFTTAAVVGSLILMILNAPVTTINPFCSAHQLQNGVELSCIVHSNHYVIVYSPEKELVNYNPSTYHTYFISGAEIGKFKVYEYENQGAPTEIRVIEV
jgi:hypothetical protein